MIVQRAEDLVDLCTSLIHGPTIAVNGRPQACSVADYKPVDVAVKVNHGQKFAVLHAAPFRLKLPIVCELVVHTLTLDASVEPKAELDV